MKLVAVEVIPYALPFRRPYVTAAGSLEQREMVLLRLRDEDGIVGLGEAVPLALRGGIGLTEVDAELRRLADDVLFASEPRDERDFLTSAIALRLSAPARCAVLTALIDLRGRRAAGPEAPGGGSRYSPRTGRRHDSDAAAAEAGPVTCNATLVAAAPAEVAEEALRWADGGFATFKLKLGAGQDVAQVRAVREAVGETARIRVDVNAVWDLETAKRRLTELEPFDIELVEQPVASLEEMADLAAATSIPLAADESVTSLEEAERAAASGACAYTGIKLSKVGGPEQALAIADVLPAYVSSALDGPVGIAAAAQVAQSLGGTDRPERLELAHGLATQRLFASTVAAVECELEGDRLHLPPGPGLGVEIDEEALQAHRI
jgi:muconate cycloisomerase